MIITILIYNKGNLTLGDDRGGPCVEGGGAQFFFMIELFYDSQLKCTTFSDLIKSK